MKPGEPTSVMAASGGRGGVGGEPEEQLTIDIPQTRPAAGSVECSAHFSPCRTWRYALWRRWASSPPAMFVGLNPSTADETQDDPTIRRCIRFARDWGYGGLVMTNLFAFRSTDPRQLNTAEDPIGPANDAALVAAAASAGVVVAAWGVHGTHNGRAQDVIDRGLLGSFTVLGLTADGHPRHPLYMRADCRPLNPLTLEAT